jgi:hypothetical protein
MDAQPGREMKTNRIATATTSLVLLLSMTAARPVPAQKPIEACTLLSLGDVSKALEQSSKAGRRMVESSPDGCIWSADPAASDTSRKVALNTHTPRAFMIMKSSTNPAIKREPVSGLGDEAYYQIYPAPGEPFIWVLKGNTAISIRVMGTKANRFSFEQDESKLLALAKAAVGKF